MLRKLLISIAGNVIALAVAGLVLSGITYGSKFWVLIVAGVVFGIVNVFIKPIITLFSAPLILLTLGLFLFLINLLMLYLTSWLVPSFEVESFGTAILATIIIAIVNFVMDIVFSRVFGDDG